MQPLGLHDAQIGDDLVTRLQGYDIARYDVGGIDGQASAVADDHGPGRQHLTDGGQGIFGLALLDEADQGVDHHHPDDHRRVDPVLQGEGDQCRCQQNIDQDVVELAQQAYQRTAWFGLGQTVWAVFGQPARSVLNTQACGMAGEVLQNLVRRLRMPGPRSPGFGLTLGTHGASADSA